MLPGELTPEFVSLVKTVVTDFDGDGNKFLKEYSIDSFDLMTLRSLLEEDLRIRFSDQEWMNVRKFSDLFKKISSDKRLEAEEKSLTCEREYQLNMPQMNVSGLSEYWYLKEIGDMHWKMIASSLGVPSDLILDNEGKRLYSTFVRIKFSSSAAFVNFKENDVLKLGCEISRFGNFFLSENILISNDKTIKAELVTSFVARGKGNSNLYKSTPAEEVKKNVRNHFSIPELIAKYHLIRKEQITNYEIDGISFDLTAPPLFELDYKLDPYHDLNGVGLLYYAAYPHIYDFCERMYMNEKFIEKEWSFNSSSIFRDIFYLGNVDLNDTIMYRLLGYYEDDKAVYFASELVRKSDMKKVSVAIIKKGINQ